MLSLGWSCGFLCQKLINMAESAVVSSGAKRKDTSVRQKTDKSKPSSNGNESMQFYRWRPLACLEPNTKFPMRLALIVLNMPLTDMLPHLMQLWNRSVLRAATDGAGNHLCDLMKQSGTEFIPDLLTGDFDSIRPEVLIYMKDKGAKIIRTPDQSFTDFTKCLKIVIRTLEHNKLEVDGIVGLGAIGGRLDQTFSNINTLYEASRLTKLPVYILGENNLACLLNAGHHTLEVDTGLESDWCGLIPLGHRCNSVKTVGLKYNLENQPMQFSGLISTSNSVAKGSKTVTIETDSPLVWTMGIKRLKLKEQISHV